MVGFSVALGLVDYINPILYLCLFLILITSLKKRINFPHWVCLIIGSIISLAAGFTIPTYKILCGLGVFDFVMPEAVVYITNIGFFIAGTALLIASFGIFRKKNLLLVILYAVFAAAILSLTASGVMKFNTIAVLIGFVGIYFLYISIAGFAAREKKYLSLGLVLFSMFMTAMLALVGIFGNMADASTHWFTQISNICCQLSLVLSAFFLFKRGKKTP